MSEEKKVAFMRRYPYDDNIYDIMVDGIIVAFISLFTNRIVASRLHAEEVGLSLHVGEIFIDSKPVKKRKIK